MSRLPHDTSGRAPISDTEPTRISVDRYISTQWMDRENRQLWPRVWQIACSVDHVATPGDFYEYSAGWNSILIVRGDD
ncbi:MAG TPA: hypothetical protein PKV27_11395, partial [Ilumatobacteraceae bacterium]|nr:hypothetical protein [Ilumatobacteraceae bacterium]